MNQKLILYSLNDDITISELKKLKNIQIDNQKKEQFLKYCNKNKINWLIQEEIFLKKTKPVPYVLYYIWNYNLIKNKKIIWIVWPRNITDFIIQTLDKFFEKIKNTTNIAIVSGLAPWTDTYAHRLSLKYNIPTIAVLGFWLVKWLSWKDRHLIKEIVDQWWLILSEFKMKQEWTNWTFPQRNRIIAWLSDILFVPQAEKKSGSLITVEYALKFKIPVWSCFSHYCDKMWEWTNQLISDWKINWVYNFNLFFNTLTEFLNLKEQNKNYKFDISSFSLKEQKVLLSIQSWNNTVEQICLDTWFDISEVLNLLSILELNWITKEISWEYVINF